MRTTVLAVLASGLFLVPGAFFLAQGAVGIDSEIGRSSSEDISPADEKRSKEGPIKAEDLPHQSLAIAAHQREALAKNVAEILADYEPTVVAWVSLTIDEKITEETKQGNGQVEYREWRKEEHSEAKRARDEDEISGDYSTEEGIEKIAFDVTTTTSTYTNVSMDPDKSSIAVTIAGDKELPRGGIAELQQLVAAATGLSRERITISERR